jgi:hypothetical protein
MLECYSVGALLERLCGSDILLSIHNWPSIWWLGMRQADEGLSQYVVIETSWIRDPQGFQHSHFSVYQAEVEHKEFN